MNESSVSIVSAHAHTTSQLTTYVWLDTRHLRLQVSTKMKKKVLQSENSSITKKYFKIVCSAVNETAIGNITTYQCSQYGCLLKFQTSVNEVQ